VNWIKVEISTGNGQLVKGGGLRSRLKLEIVECGYNFKGSLTGTRHYI